jgi:hypothetical protein
MPQKSDPAELANLIRRLVAQPSEIVEREKKVVAFHRPDAAKRIVERLSEGRA